MRTVSRHAAALAALALIALAIAGSVAPGRAAPAQVSAREGEGAGEFDVRAAYLYNFTKFVTWPEKSPPRGVFAIGVLGEDPFGASVTRALESKTVQGMRIVIRRVNTPEEAAACQLVYLAGGEEKRLAALFERLRGLPVLTVGDCRGFLRGGGMIRFRTEQERVQFDVSLAPASEAHLEISSRLLQVARTVHPDARKEE
ncbi:MAG: YfiR family protein [Candidatus Eisenbacteria bacterium]|nr:YfiR family protein [Candidatus Eisenbacteria bacterium]